jgi:hypothetical protein
MRTVTEKDCNGTEYTINVSDPDDLNEEDIDPASDMMSFAICVASDPNHASEEPISPERLQRWVDHLKELNAAEPPRAPYEPAVGHVVVYCSGEINQSVVIDAINADGTLNVTAVYLGEGEGLPTKWVAARDEIIELC